MKKNSASYRRIVESAYLEKPIRFHILISIAFHNLFYKKLRTTLTILGVMVGVGAVVFLMAFGFGLQNLVTSQVTDSNSIRTVDVSSSKTNIIRLDSPNKEKIEGFTDVVSVSRVFNYAGQIQYNNSQTGAVIYGTDQNYIDLSAFELLAGPNLSLKDPGKLIVNSAFLKAVGISNPQAILSQELKVTARISQLDRQPGAKAHDVVINAKVSAVVESGSGSEIYVPSTIFMMDGIDYASQAKVLVANKEAVPIVEKRITSLGFSVSSPFDTLKQINQIFVLLNLLFLGFGGIGLIIAILGMFNTLTITLLERTKEIGLMRALGARKRDIRRLFVIESVGLSMLGGILGITGAFLLSRVIDFVLNRLASGRGLGESFTAFSFNASLIGWIILSSAILGLIVVYLPARRASRINPIEALHN